MARRVTLKKEMERMIGREERGTCRNLRAVQEESLAMSCTRAVKSIINWGMAQQTKTKYG